MHGSRVVRRAWELLDSRGRSDLPSVAAERPAQTGDKRLASGYNKAMFQFSIRSLLLLTTMVAVIVWVLFAPPHVVGALVMLAICIFLPPMVLAGILYLRDYWRAFFIGAAPWAVVLAFG